MKNIQIIFLTLISFTLTFCNSKTKLTTVAHSTDTLEKNDCLPYFIFDHVVHYSIKTTDSEYVLLATKENPSKNEILLTEILSKGVFKSLKDTSVVEHLETIGYKKQELPTELNDSINDIFCERKHENSIMAACLPMYRNVFVFKYHGKTVGLAKICYSCMLSNIVGTSRNTSDFGQSEDFDRLRQLMLRENSL